MVTIEKAPFSMFGKVPINREKSLIKSYGNYIIVGTTYAFQEFMGVPNKLIYGLVGIPDKWREEQAKKYFGRAKEKLQMLI